MPYYRKKRSYRPRRSGTTRRTIRRRRTYGSRRRYNRTGRRSKLSYGTSYTFKRTVHEADIDISDTTGGHSYAMSFALSAVPNYTEFTNLYDNYKITGVAVELRPTYTGSDLNTLAYANNVAIPDVRSVVDYDDPNPITTENELLQHQNIKWTRGHRVHRRYFRPKPVKPIYKDAVSFGYAPSRIPEWYDTAYPTIPHYALKIWIDSLTGTSTTNIVYRVYTTYYLRFRGVK